MPIAFTKCYKNYIRDSVASSDYRNKNETGERAELLVIFALTYSRLNFADFADLDNYIGQKQRIIPEGVEKSLIREIKSARKLIHLDTLDRNEKTKVYKSGPVFRCDATNRLK